MAITDSDSVAQDQIKAFYERWERLEEEKEAISGDLKELFAEAKGNGFDTKVLRKLFRDQKIDASERQEYEALYDLYAAALNAPRVRDARDAREDDEEFDPETGEIKSTTTNGGDNETSAVSEQHLIDRRRQDDAQEGHSAHDVEVRTRPVNSAEEPGRSLASVDTPTGSDIPATISEPASPPPEIAEPGDRGAVVPSAAPVVASNVVEMPKRITFSDKPHSDCLDPERCGGFSSLKLCQRCTEAAAGGQVA